MTLVAALVFTGFGLFSGLVLTAGVRGRWRQERKDLLADNRRLRGVVQSLEARLEFAGAAGDDFIRKVGLRQAWKKQREETDKRREGAQ